MTISGGQKARISLARALFANCRIYLLDDIFASLDRQVADRIFKRAVKEMLANKTVLMVTTDIQVSFQFFTLKVSQIRAFWIFAIDWFILYISSRIAF